MPQRWAVVQSLVHHRKFLFTSSSSVASGFASSLPVSVHIECLLPPNPPSTFGPHLSEPSSGEMIPSGAQEPLQEQLFRYRQPVQNEIERLFTK